MLLKKAIAVFLSIFLVLSGGIGQVQAEEVPKESELYAKAAVLMDGDSGRILYGKNETLPLANASTTKILTCIIALENCEMDEQVTFSNTAAAAPKVHLGAGAGKTFWMADLLYAMMLESYNDCAVAIAEQIAGTTEAFSELMNDYASRIGCKDTFFLTPNGLDAEKEGEFHHTTAEDLARMMRYCIKESTKADAFLQITGEREYQFSDVEGKGTYHCYNHNAFLQMMDGALSGKTGFTGNAGYCYVGALKRDRKTYIVALLACGWPNNRTYKWSDTKKLMQYGILQYKRKELDEITLDKERYAAVEVENAQSVRIGAQTKTPLQCVQTYDTGAVLLAEGEEISVEYQIAKRLQAPVQKGTFVGEIRFLAGDLVVRKYVLKTTEDVKKRDYFWCFKQVVLLAV